MSKYLLEDMVKAKRISQEINKEPASIEMRERIEIIEIIETDINHNPKKSRYFLWFIAFISAIFCFFAISLFFAKAQVVVNPKTEDVVLNENLSADKDSNTNSGLSFDLVVIPGEESKNIPVTGEKDVSTKAIGTVCIFNTYSSSPQNLDIDTRLEGSNGKIYKTQVKTTVQGMNKGNASNCPNEIGIYAAESGAEYNSSSPLDFTIFGFKGTPKYSKFKVESKSGTQITGGFIGKAPNISDADTKTATAELKSTLQTDLLQKATVQIPDGFILFKDAVVLNTDDSNISSVYNADSTATLTLKGTLYGIILSEKELTAKIAIDNIDKYNGDGSDVYISNIKDLVFSLSSGSISNSTQAVSDSTISPSIADTQSINFSLSGSAKIVWKLNIDKFVGDLLGKSKSDFTQISSQYNNIDSATLTLSPIWKMSIPDQAKDVKVIVNYPQ